MTRTSKQYRDANGHTLRMVPSTRQRMRHAIHTRAADGSKAIKGVAAVFHRAGDDDTEYWLWSDMVERIQPGAFDRAIQEQHDARALFNHDANQLLGRVSADTCQLEVTSEGLAYEIPYDENDPDHQRVACKIERGDVSGSSFAFIARKAEWIEEKNADGETIWVRNIVDVDLFDVGPVTWPAYEATTAGRSNRSIDGGELPPAISELLAERDAFMADQRSQEPGGPCSDAVAVRLRLLELEELAK